MAKLKASPQRLLLKVVREGTALFLLLR